MARRKKEIKEFHRDSIVTIAEKLFDLNGVSKTTMDEIAKEAGYSKATLYVYFKNKEEIVHCIILDSMKILYEQMKSAISASEDTLGKYYAICYKLAHYYERHPYYFRILLGEINVDIENHNTPPVFIEIYDIGEQINCEIATLFQYGIEKGVIKKDIQIDKIILVLWAEISGVIQMANEKEQYILKKLRITKKEFLKYSFDTLFYSIAERRDTNE